MNTLKKIRANQKGFTLVELIVVVAILGVLAAVAVPNYMNYLYKSRVNTDIDTGRAILNVVRTHAMTTGMKSDELAGALGTILTEAGMNGNKPATDDDTLADFYTIDCSNDDNFSITFTAGDLAGKYKGDYLVTEHGSLPIPTEGGDTTTAAS